MQMADAACNSCGCFDLEVGASIRARARTQLAVEIPAGVVELDSNRVAHPAQGVQRQNGGDNGVLGEVQDPRRPGGPGRGAATARYVEPHARAM